MADYVRMTTMEISRELFQRGLPHLHGPGLPVVGPDDDLYDVVAHQ